MVRCGFHDPNVAKLKAVVDVLQRTYFKTISPKFNYLRNCTSVSFVPDTQQSAQIHENRQKSIRT